MENLELASQHAAPAWKMYNNYLETSHKRQACISWQKRVMACGGCSMSKSLEATRTDIEQINRKRKLEQVVFCSWPLVYVFADLVWAFRWKVHKSYERWRGSGQK